MNAVQAKKNLRHTVLTKMVRSLLANLSPPMPSSIRHTFCCFFSLKSAYCSRPPDTYSSTLFLELTVAHTSTYSSKFDQYNSPHLSVLLSSSTKQNCSSNSKISGKKSNPGLNSLSDIHYDILLFRLTKPPPRGREEAAASAAAEGEELNLKTFNLSIHPFHNTNPVHFYIRSYESTVCKSGHIFYWFVIFTSFVTCSCCQFTPVHSRNKLKEEKSDLKCLSS